MSIIEAPPLTIVEPGGGRSGGLAPGIGVIFKLGGAHTDGALAVVEHPFEIGALVPPHLHTREDEYSIVLEGEIGFRSGDREVVLGPGGYITKPRNEMHAMWNAGGTRARMIEIIRPAGFERFVAELADLVESGSFSMTAMAEMAEGYGLRFGNPDWLPGVVARYNLTVPPDA